MKNRIITGIIFIILGGLIAWGPQTIFPVCGIHTEQGLAETGSAMGAHTSESKHMENTENTDQQTPMVMTTDSVMKCHWTAQAELGTGILIGLLGLLLMIFKSGQTRLGLNLSAILNGILALLIPTALIGVCGGVHMSCRALTLPALIILSSLVIAAGAVNAIYLNHSIKKDRSDDEADSANHTAIIDQ